MPVIAVVGAIGALTLGGGAAAIGAIAAGTITLATVLPAIAAVGATLGAIGAVTGDKTLGLVGTVLGGVGAIGSLASSAGLLGDTSASLFGSTTAGVGTSANIAAGTTAAAGTISPAMQAAGDAANADIINSLGSFTPDLALPSFGVEGSLGTAGNATSLGGLINQPDAATLAARLNPTSSGVNAPATSVTADSGLKPTLDMAAMTKAPAAPGVSVPVTGAPSPSDDASLSAIPKGTYVGQVGKAADGTDVTWNGTAWAKQGGFFQNLISSPTGQLGLLQAGGSLISGMFDPLKPAQVDALNAQAAANRAATSLSMTQQSNIAAPIPIAKRVAGPAITGAPNGGLINNQSAVTGQAAA